MKPQGHVLSPALRFAIISKFLCQQQEQPRLHASTKLLINKLQSSKDPEWVVNCVVAQRLRRRMNRELGLEVTKLQWKLALHQFHHYFRHRQVEPSDGDGDVAEWILSWIHCIFLDQRVVDQRDVLKLSTWELWRIHHGTLSAHSFLWWFHRPPIIQATDSRGVQVFKCILLYTLFPILALVQIVVSLSLYHICLILYTVVFWSLIPCICFYWGMRRRRDKAQLKELRAQLQRDQLRYLTEGIATLGFVSDRWVEEEDEYNPSSSRRKYCATVSYFEKDGTKVNVTGFENPDHLDMYPEDVPMVTLSGRPMSGLPIHEVVAL
jgi:hypothetical protein